MDWYISFNLSSLAEKQLKKVPSYISDGLENWMRTVKRIGLNETRKIPGYHDEPLKGDRYGQRSIRLNRSYRAIYEANVDGEITIIVILEVNKHDYR